jgi:hypothetical protein
MNATFQITVTNRSTGSLETLRTVKGASAMEDEVTRLHREYPSHIFDCDVTFA